MPPPESSSSMAYEENEKGPLISYVSHTSNSDDDKPKSTSCEIWLHEAWLLMRLAMPTVFINVTLMIPSVFMSSYIGRYEGETALSGMMLGFSVLNISFMAVITGLLSAVDTLCPQAFGAKNYPEVGAIALRGLIVCFVYSIIPIILILSYLKSFLSNTLGLDKGATEFAVEFTRIWLPTLPFYVAFVVIWKFLSAQEIIYPIVYSGILSSFVILPLCVKYFAFAFGFDGVILAYDVFMINEALTALIIIWYFKAYVPLTWSTTESITNKFERAIDRKQLYSFCKLALGGVVATTEWWFWEVICVLVGKFGVKALAAHAVATQYINIAFMFVMGFSLALNVRIGSSLAVNAKRARLICYWGFTTGVVISIIFAIIFGVQKKLIISMFTDSKEVAALCDIIWPHITIYIFHICLFAMNIGIVNALGYQWVMGSGVLVILWVFTLPSVYYISYLNDGGFIALWKMLYVPYASMNIFFLFLLSSIDWDSLGSEVKSSNMKEMHQASLIATETPSDYGSVSSHDSPFASSACV